MRDNMLSDQELDLLLAKASEPQVPTDFAERFASRNHHPQASNVIAFPKSKTVQAKPRFAWPMAAALAASLIFGVWAGNTGQFASLLSSQIETASNTDFAPLDFEDITTLAEDNKT
jgi:hypothetical protein